MIHIMQLFNFIKSSVKNLMNLPSLHCSSHLRQFKEKKNLKIQLINQLDYFFQANYLQSTQILVQTNCITFSIIHLDHHQYYLSSSSQIIYFVTNLSKSYLEMTSNLQKSLVTLAKSTTY